MNEGDYYCGSFLDSDPSVFLDNLFQEEESLFNTNGDSTQNNMYLFDNQRERISNEILNSEKLRNNDVDNSLNSRPYPYGISYQNKRIENSQQIIYYSGFSNGTIDNISLPKSNCLKPAEVALPSKSSMLSQSPVVTHTNHVSIKSRVQDSAERRNQHNISEKKRIERINNCINELYHLLELSGVCIRKSKVTILSEATKKLLHLEQVVKELKQKVYDAEVAAHQVLKEPGSNPRHSSVNYHVMFLQYPIPQAILSADGQFVDANSQFCSLTQKTVQQLRKMTLFKFASVDDLPCAFSSYSNILRTDNNTNGVCMFRHCYLSDCFQPVFFSLSVVRNDQNQPINFICNILPIVACTCTDNNINSRTCNGQLRGKDGKIYQICNPVSLLPWCTQLVDSNTGTPIL